MLGNGKSGHISGLTARRYRHILMRKKAVVVDYRMLTSHRKHVKQESRVMSEKKEPSDTAGYDKSVKG